MIARGVIWLALAVASAMTASGTLASAQDAAPMVRMLKTGRLPPERIGNVLGLVCQRGAAADLTYVLERTVEPDGFPPAVRLQALAGMTTAAETRKVIPEFTTEQLDKLLADPSPAVQAATVKLAGAWKADSAAPALEKLLASATASAETRREALTALVALGGPAASRAVEKLLDSPDTGAQVFGIAALVDTDPDRAVARAANLAATGAVGDHMAALLAPFLERQGATDKLATALRNAELNRDVAKLALRHLYAAGRSDAALVEVLSAAAGLNADSPPLDAEQLKTLSAEVLANGDPVRGEKVFRRADLSCLKCHAVSGAGGDIGPDLSPVGSVSPPDYIITSIMTPDLSIKENFITRAIVTDAGKIYQGIVADRDDQRVVLKEATGDKITIPTADIVDEIEGKSLMPKGLAGFLTHQEFLDLVRFVSSLGRPGAYEVRSRPTVQRWRVLPAATLADATSAVAEATLPAEATNAPESSWLPFYGQVAGELPLDELIALSSGGATATKSAAAADPIFLRSDFEVAAEGDISVTLNGMQGVRLWIDQSPLVGTPPLTTTLPAGPHRLYLRVDPTDRDGQPLVVFLDKAHGSTAVVTIVGGR